MATARGNSRPMFLASDSLLAHPPTAIQTDSRQSPRNHGAIAPSLRLSQRRIRLAYDTRFAAPRNAAGGSAIHQTRPASASKPVITIDGPLLWVPCVCAEYRHLRAHARPARVGRRFPTGGLCHQTGSSQARASATSLRPCRRRKPRRSLSSAPPAARASRLATRRCNTASQQV